jgi:hypothetical protein
VTRSVRLLLLLGLAVVPAIAVAAAIVERVLARTQGRSIIVMHLMGAPNALRERGFRFVRLGELLAG